MFSYYLLPFFFGGGEGVGVGGGAGRGVRLNTQRRISLKTFYTCGLLIIELHA